MHLQEDIKFDVKINIATWCKRENDKPSNWVQNNKILNFPTYYQCWSEALFPRSNQHPLECSMLYLKPTEHFTKDNKIPLRTFELWWDVCWRSSFKVKPFLLRAKPAFSDATLCSGSTIADHQTKQANIQQQC